MIWYYILPYPSSLRVALDVSLMFHSCTLFTDQCPIRLAVNFQRYAVLQAEFRLWWCVPRWYTGWRKEIIVLDEVILQSIIARWRWAWSFCLDTANDRKNKPVKYLQIKKECFKPVVTGYWICKPFFTVRFSSAEVVKNIYGRVALHRHTAGRGRVRSFCLKFQKDIFNNEI